MKAESGALSAALGFTAADLQANRQGALSPAQRERMQHARRRDAFIAAGLFCLLALAATVLVYIGQFNRNVISSGAGVMLIFINAAMVGRAGRAFMRMSGDLRANNVDRLSGDVERVLRRGRASDSYLVRISGVELNVTQEVFVSLEHNAPYRIYRTRISQVLLSAERGN